MLSSFKKRFFNSATKNNKINKNKILDGSLESDAAPVNNADPQPVTSNTNISSGFSEELTIGNIGNNCLYPSEQEESQNNGILMSESYNMHVNNVNQPLVMQFSHINGLQIGSTYNINSKDKGLKKNEITNKPKKEFPRTNTIEAMMKSEDEPDTKVLYAIATHLGSDFKNFMRQLGYSDGEISAAYLDHNNYGVKEVIYQLLLDWQRNADDKLRSVGYLTTVLWNCGYRQCVYRLKPVWKSKIYTNNMQE